MFIEPLTIFRIQATDHQQQLYKLNKWLADQASIEAAFTWLTEQMTAGP